MTVMPVPATPPRRTRVVAGWVAALAAFEFAWFACVLGAAHGWPWAGVAVTAVVIGGFVALSDKPRADAALIGAALAIGLLWDSALLNLGWVAYAAPGPLPLLAPGWILALWALFAITLRAPLRWLHTRLPLAALLGAIGGPLSYAAAERLGACRLPEPGLALAALALGWAAITPLLLVLARRWDAR